MSLISDNRWTARPRLAIAVRVAAHAIPVVASFGAALITQRLVDAQFPSAPWTVGAVVSLIVAMGTLFAGERLARRFLPLAMLLKLALLFPDQVPSRLGIALRAASPKRLARKLESSDVTEAVAAERVLALVSALSAHDRLTRGHCERVRAVTMLIADEMGIKGEDRDKLEWAALLHDVGKITVSPAILNKRGKPNDEEWAELRTHPGNGAPLAGDLAEWLGDWVHAIDQHHEKFDGTGYPLGLAGSEISQAARIVSTADAFEVMTAVRSYKKAMSVADARAELAACNGTHFDPLVVRSFASLSVAKLHRALGPASWAVSLPFRGAAVQALRGASSLVGGSAPSALAGLTAAFVMSIATTTAADAVDGRFESRPEQVQLEVADAAVAPTQTQAGTEDETADPADDEARPASSTTSPGSEPGTGSEGEAEGMTLHDSEGATPASSPELDVLPTTTQAGTGLGPLADAFRELGDNDDLDLGDLDLDDLDLGQLDLGNVDLGDLDLEELALVSGLLNAAGELPDALDGVEGLVGGLTSELDLAIVDDTTGLASDVVGGVTAIADDVVGAVTDTATGLVGAADGAVAAASGAVDETVVTATEVAQAGTAVVADLADSGESSVADVAETGTATAGEVANSGADVVAAVADSGTTVAEAGAGSAADVAESGAGTAVDVVESGSGAVDTGAEVGADILDDAAETGGGVVADGTDAVADAGSALGGLTDAAASSPGEPPASPEPLVSNEAGAPDGDSGSVAAPVADALDDPEGALEPVGGLLG